jgi:hypothetical protein|tara:strand:- start:498 stop:1007 length:510 start_codon:yes stop_codon:yes gene_type:complete
MIDVSLVEEPVSTDNFSYQIPLVPSVFLGFILKNEYDNKRLHINEKYKPKKFIKIYKINGEMKMLPLYGICLEINKMGEEIINLIKRQENANNINLVVYQNLLSQYDISCDDCYGYFKNSIYPIDFNKFRYLTDDKISEDKKILQHMLNLNEDKFDFQKFGSILSLILT